MVASEIENGVHVSLTSENVNFFGLIIKNSQLTFIVICVILAILLISAALNPKLVPGRWQAFWEWAIESLLNLTESNLGRNKVARRLFPLVATLFIFIVFANWFSLLPGVGTIGHPEVEVVPASGKAVGTETYGPTKATYALATTETEVFAQASETAAKQKNKLASGEAVRVKSLSGGWAEIEAVPEKVFTNDKAGYKSEGEIAPITGEKAVSGFVRTSQLGAAKVSSLLVPIIRPPNADLNTTLAMALIAVIVANAVAIASHGVGGWVKEFFPKPYAMDILLTPLEIIGQVSRVLSLTFRLFGNIFAGEALLTIILTIAAPALVIFLALELFFGFIQALVFSSLTLVYLTLAFTGLGEEEHSDEHGHGDEHSGEHNHTAEVPAVAAAKEPESVGAI